MPRLSKEERDELLARLADDHDDAPEEDTGDDDTDTEEDSADDAPETTPEPATGDEVAIDNGDGEVMIIRGAAATRLLERYFDAPTPAKRHKSTPAQLPAKATRAAAKRTPRVEPDAQPQRTGPRYFR
jgi:hypothetical protein